MATTIKFSWTNHILSVISEGLPLALLQLLALIFEFDNGPLELWWMGIMGGYGSSSWAVCARDHKRKMARVDQGPCARLVAKLALIILGLPLVAVNTLSTLADVYQHCQSMNRLLYSWGQVGAFRGVPELFDDLEMV